VFISKRASNGSHTHYISFITTKLVFFFIASSDNPKSLLTGKDYYKFNCDVSEGAWNRVKNLFEYFGEPGSLGTLEGWLTSSPELVEEYLLIRNPIVSRKAEIEKQKINAENVNFEIIERLSIVN